MNKHIKATQAAGSVRLSQNQTTSDRNRRRKSKTRLLLLDAAYRIMSSKGIEATTVSDITSAADVGLGTFYNYFNKKEALVIEVLDCIVRDLCERNDSATTGLRQIDPAAGQAISMRLTLKEMLTNPMWKWWVKRPDLLAERLREGAYYYGTRNITAAIEAGKYDVPLSDVDDIWAHQMWLAVGGVKNILDSKTDKIIAEKVLIQSIMRAIGLSAAAARDVAEMDLPDVRPPAIDFQSEKADQQ